MTFGCDFAFQHKSTIKEIGVLTCKHVANDGERVAFVHHTLTAVVGIIYVQRATQMMAPKPLP